MHRIWESQHFLAPSGALSRARLSTMKLCHVLAALVLLLAKGKDEVHHLRGKGQVTNEASQEEAGAGLETEEGASTGAEQKARVCRSWVSCKNGFFGNIRCEGNRYCTRWGAMEKAAEKPAESAAEMDTENEAAQGQEAGAGLETEEGASTGAEQKARVCRSWVSCKNGFFGNIRCEGNRYCTRWGAMEKAAEKPAESAAEMDTENEAAQGEEAGAGLETEEGASTGAEQKARVCRSWVSCKNGFFGNIRCDGNRYCTRWGAMEKAAEKPAESAAEMDTENEAAQGEEAGAGLETEEGASTGAEQKARVCRSWVSCKNGFFGNIRCEGNRYCTRWGAMEKAAEKPAESAAEMDTENEAAQGEEAGAGLETEEGASTGAEQKARVCRSWVSCKNGFFGNIRCEGNRYCTRWGAMEKAAEKPAESAAEMDTENEAAQGEEAGAGLETEEGASTGAEQKARVCRSWVSCKNGFFGNIRCEGNRYCTRWGAMEKAAEKPAESAAEMDTENEAAQGEEAGAGLETEEGASTGAEQKARVCRSWVSCKNGFFGNIRCDGNRYCTRWGAMEKAAEKPAESAAEMDTENEAAQGEEAGAGLETEEGASTGAEQKARVCRSWVSCKNGFFGNIRCEGNRYCTRWGAMEKAAEKPAESAAEMDTENEAAQGEEAGAGLETEEGASTGAEQKARVCRSWVSCKNGFFGNIRCEGNRYCTRWGAMEKAAEKPAESAAEMDTENEAAQGEEAGAGLETEEGASTGAEQKARVCRSWVSCKNGFFGNIRCEGNRYCTRWG